MRRLLAERVMYPNGCETKRNKREIKMNEKKDFIVTTHGSIWRFNPVSETAKNFSDTDLDLEGWQWIGAGESRSFGVDARIANQLVSSLEDEGFVLELR